jgi:hypothetical protein
MVARCLPSWRVRCGPALALQVTLPPCRNGLHGLHTLQLAPISLDLQYMHAFATCSTPATWREAGHEVEWQQRKTMTAQLSRGFS